MSTWSPRLRRKSLGGPGMDDMLAALLIFWLIWSAVLMAPRIDQAILRWTGRAPQAVAP